MATRRWRAKAKDVLQVDTVTIANTWAQGDTITLTCDGIDFLVTIGTLVTTSQVATTLYEAFNGSTLTDTSASCSPTIAQGGAQLIPQFAEAVATVSSAVVTLTGRTAGKPLTFTCAENTVGTGTATLASSVVATGKHWFSNADNWTGDTVPVDTDTIVFDSGSIPCKYGLSPAIQPTTFIKTKGYTGTIGLPEINTDNSSKPYNEYRTKYLTFDDNGGATCTYYLEQGEGSGSGLVRIDAGAGKSIFNVYGSGTRTVTGQPCVLLLGTHADNVLNMPQGDVGVAYFDGEVSTLVTIRAGNGTTTGATLTLGDGMTLTSAAIDISGATVSIDSACSGEIDIHSGGTLTVTGTGAFADIDVQNGTCNYRTTGTLTTLAVKKGGTFTRAGDLRAATITNAVQLYPGATFLDPNKSLTLSAGYKQNGGVNADFTIDVGTDRTFAVT